MVRDTYDRLTVGNTQLAYVERGAGEPVVFVHGGLSDLTYLEPMAGAFAGRFRAIAYSRRYAWPNHRLPDGAADPIEVQVQDLAGLVAGLRAAPAHLVGHSWGASVCLLLAAQHPELTRTLTLIEPEVFALFVGSPPSPLRILRLAVKRPRTAMIVIKAANDAMAIRKAYKSGADERAVRIALNWANGFDFYAEMDPAIRSHLMENVAFSRAGALADPINIGVEDVMRIRCPTLLVVGELSPKLFRVSIDELSRIIGTAQVYVVPHASHGMISQNPQALNEAIYRFLASTGES